MRSEVSSAGPLGGLPGAASAPVLLIAAHPDDEVIGAGSQLPLLAGLTIVHVTDGAPRDMRDAAAYGFATCEAYARARREELLAALALVGIDASRTREFCIADQEASYRLADLARRVAGLLLAIKPAAVLTHSYEGGHPDHDATAFAVHAARRLAEAVAGMRVPIIEFTSYHAGPSGMETFDFLPYEGCAATTVPLSEAERDLKRRMIGCFVTQRQTLARFPVEIERYRAAPAYDFTRPPHPGKLFYDNYEWGIRSVEWREKARSALNELGLAGPL